MPFFKVAIAFLVSFTVGLSLWLASSLVIYHNHPTWLALFAALLLCPLLPLAWDLWRKKRRTRKKSILTKSDRLIVRIVTLNLAFIIGLLVLSPHNAFRALSVRGDWFLGDRQQVASVEWVRQNIFKLAHGLEKLYLGASNPQEQQLADGQNVFDIHEKAQIILKQNPYGSYLQYIPDRLSASARLLVIVHGSIGKNESAIDAAKVFIERWTELAEEKNLILIAPVFDKANFGSHAGPGGGYRGLFGREIWRG